MSKMESSPRTSREPHTHDTAHGRRHAGWLQGGDDVNIRLRVLPHQRHGEPFAGNRKDVLRLQWHVVCAQGPCAPSVRRNTVSGLKRTVYVFLSCTSVVFLATQQPYNTSRRCSCTNVSPAGIWRHSGTCGAEHTGPSVQGPETLRPNNLYASIVIYHIRKKVRSAMERRTVRIAAATGGEDTYPKNPRAKAPLHWTA